MNHGDKPGYEIDSDQPSEHFLRARNVAGRALQDQFEKESGKAEPPRDYKWIKAELTWPSFDHLTFGYGNQVFSVLVVIIDGGRSSLTQKERNRCVEACAVNNLIPCRFGIDARSVKPICQDWNLTHLVSGRDIIPSECANAYRITMSEWELQNFSIQLVRDHITDQLSANVLSFCDVIGVDPQIWFEDKTGSRCWVVVRHYGRITGQEKDEWIGFERSNRQLQGYDGFLAAFSMASAEPIVRDREGHIVPLSERFSGYAPLYRGDGFFVKFDGLQRVYVS